jgi:methionyl-tRNA formyltransferase
LPKYRGASPIQSAILNEEQFSGVSAMMMEEGLDCGDILGFRYIKSGKKRVDVLFDELSDAAAKLCIKILKEFKKLKPIKQIDADSSYCVKIKKENGLIDFSLSAKELHIKYLAYTPWPGVYLKNGLKLKEVELIDTKSCFENYGVIKEIFDDGIALTCKVGLIKILKLQAPSKKEVDAVEYLRGKRLRIGDRLV